MSSTRRIVLLSRVLSSCSGHGWATRLDTAILAIRAIHILWQNVLSERSHSGGLLTHVSVFQRISLIGRLHFLSSIATNERICLI